MGRVTGGLLDLETHFSFYGAYHSTPGNILLHTVFVWPIVFSSLMILHITPPFMDLDLKTYGVVINLGFILSLFYSVFYILLEKRAGILASFLCLGCWIGANLTSESLGPSLNLKIALIMQAVCWSALFIGHAVFEGRAPALFDNLIQAFLTAPFFVLLEVLQSVFGYEPNPGFHTRVKTRTESEIKKWRESRKVKQ